jgi:hypothetical protein
MPETQLATTRLGRSAPIVAAANLELSEADAATIEGSS